VNIKFNKNGTARRPAREGALGVHALAVFASVAVHGGLLVATSAGVAMRSSESKPGDEDTVIDFVVSAAPAEDAAPPEPVRALETIPERVFVASRVRETPKPLEPAAVAPVKDDATTEPPAEEPVRGAGVPSEGNGVASSDGGLAVAMGGGDGGGAGTGTARGPDAAPVDLRALLLGWRKQVNAVVGAKASREYPLAARRTGTQGRVVVGVVVDANGHIVSVELKGSSGSPMLDGAALASLKSLGSVPPPPRVLHWEPRALSIPVEYSLEVL
jgi:protein TonB